MRAVGDSDEASQLKMQGLTVDEVRRLTANEKKLFHIGLEQRVSNYMKLYNSFINAGRKVLVAHNRFVSVFNLTKRSWAKHYKMDDIVLQIFRNQKVGANSTEDSASNFRVGILIGR